MYTSNKTEVINIDGKKLPTYVGTSCTRVDIKITTTISAS